MLGACVRNRQTRNAVNNIPRLLSFTNSEPSPTDVVLSVVEGRHGILADWRPDSDGLHEGPADPGAYPVDRLGDSADPGAYPVDRLLNPDDRLGALDGRDPHFAGPAGVALRWPQRVHHDAIVAGLDEELPRPVAYPDGPLGCRGCLAEDRGGPLEGSADPGGYPACLVSYLDDLGRDPRSRSPSVRSWDHCTPVSPATRPRERSVIIASCFS